MSVAANFEAPPAPVQPVKPHLDHRIDVRAVLIFLAILAAGLFYMAYSIYADIQSTGRGPVAILPFLLLAVAMLIAFRFEFVNGFQDTANAVATVIYTLRCRRRPPSSGPAA